VFEYTPSGDAGEEVFILVDASGAVVSVSSTSPISAAGLGEGNYEIYALIYDPATAGNLPGLLSAGSALADIESELNATACGSISAAVSASVNADACGCIEPQGACLTDICPCAGEPNEIKLSTGGYTTDGSNEQWYIVVSDGAIVTSQQAGTDGSVTIAGLPDGTHQVYAVNYDPVANPNVTTALSDGSIWSNFTAGVGNETYCADFAGPQEITVDELCDCVDVASIEISDPCSCDSPGNIDLDGDGEIDLVDDVITINGPPGETWCIDDNPTPSALDNAGNVIPDGTCAEEVSPGIYELVVYHPADGTGYGLVSFVGSGSVLLPIGNATGCDCEAPPPDCTANEGSVSTDDTNDYCDNDDVTFTTTVSGNENGVGIAEASPGMYNLGAGSTATYNILGLEPGDYCTHSFNYLTSDFNPMNELQILNATVGNITSIDALLALTGTAGNFPICGAITSTACDAFSIYPEISFDTNLTCDVADLDNYSVDVINISGGNGSASIEISDGANSYNPGDPIPNDTQVTITVSDGICSASAELNGNCLDLDCPASATADAVMQVMLVFLIPVVWLKK